MSHVLFAWELGGATGHLHHVGRTAAALADRGHRITIVSRNLADTGRLLTDPRFAILQAPLHLQPSRLPAAASYAELLFRVGYASEATLWPLLGAWRALIDLASPDLVVAEHAPTALLAARTFGLNRAMFGTGFPVPPLDAPMPCLQPWARIPERRLAEGEARCLAVVNRVLTRIGAAPVGCVADLFDADARFACVISEVDPFGPRFGDTYRGFLPPLRSVAPGAVPSPGRDGIFAYYPAAFPLFEPLLDALTATGRPALVAAPDAPPELVARTQAGPVRIVARQVDLAKVAGNVALAINYGSPGSAGALLAAGRRLACLPLHIEQHLIAHRLSQQGLARVLPIGGKGPELAGLLRAALDDDALAANAQAYAARHRGDDTEAGLCELVDGLETLARGTGKAPDQSAAPASSVST